MARSLDLPTVLRADAVLNVGAGLALVLGAPALAGPLHVASRWPLWALGALLVVNGVEHALVARGRPPARGAVLAFVAGDALFAAALLWVAVADPTGADTWARWATAATADLAVVFGVLKLVALRRTAAPGRVAAGAQATGHRA